MPRPKLLILRDAIKRRADVHPNTLSRYASGSVGKFGKLVLNDPLIARAVYEQELELAGQPIPANLPAQPAEKAA